MPGPVVSVIMRSYNHGAYIRESVASVLSQTLGDIELIIIDDCSGDDSQELIRELARTDTRIRIILHPRNKGMAVGMNEGFRASRGRYIAFIDSDDVWEREKLEKQLTVLTVEPQSVVWTEGRLINEQSAYTGEKFSDFPWVEGRAREGDIFPHLLQGNYLLLSSMMLSRVVAIKYPFWHQLRYLNDWAFNLQVACGHRFIFMSECLTRYRVHSTSTNRDERGYRDDYVRAYALIPRRLKRVLNRRDRYDMVWKAASLCEQAGYSLKARYYTLWAFLIDPSRKEARDDLRDVLRTRFGSKRLI